MEPGRGPFCLDEEEGAMVLQMLLAMISEALFGSVRTDTKAFPAQMSRYLDERFTRRRPARPPGA
jgi:hypothetical protein